MITPDHSNRPRRNTDDVPMFWYEVSLIAIVVFMLLAVFGGAA